MSPHPMTEDPAFASNRSRSASSRTRTERQRRSSSERLLVAAGLLALAFPGCGGPPPDGEDDLVPPTLELGLSLEGPFEELADGDPCPIVYGAQGGAMLPITLRLRGLEGDLLTTGCSATTAAGDPLANKERELEIRQPPHAWVQTLLLLILVDAEGELLPSVDHLFGQTVSLSCTVSDAFGHGAEQLAHVVLSEEQPGAR